MNITDIKEFLEKSEHNWTLEVAEDALVIINEDELTAVMTVSNSQILVESLLFPQAELVSPADFDHEILFAHKALPLTTVGKSTFNDETYYCAFGALSSESKNANIEKEVAMLFINSVELLQFASRFFKSNNEG
jgi:uncharacterized protein YjfI (DUF2170 family)